MPSSGSPSGQLRPDKDIGELFCYQPTDQSSEAFRARRTFHCSILQDRCVKNNDDLRNDPVLDGPLGVCTVKNSGSGETVVCPVRLYAGAFSALKEMAKDLLLRGAESPVFMLSEWRQANQPPSCIVITGQGHGRELDTPVGKIDWTCLLLDANRRVSAFSWIEVQSIDTTGNYRNIRQAYLKGLPAVPPSGHGLNWENVNKRIIPQLIRKGVFLLGSRDVPHRGIGFLTDANVFERFTGRLGRPLVFLKQSDPAANFLLYSVKLAGDPSDGCVRPTTVVSKGWTTIDELCESFLASPPWNPAVWTQIQKILSG